MLALSSSTHFLTGFVDHPDKPSSQENCFCFLPDCWKEDNVSTYITLPKILIVFRTAGRRFDINLLLQFQDRSFSYFISKLLTSTAIYFRVAVRIGNTPCESTLTVMDFAY